MSRDRPEERAARQIVQLSMSDAVIERYDNGSRDRMVDATIRLNDGSVAGLEVVTDTDPAYRQTWDRLVKNGQIIDAPGLRHTWHLVVRTGASIRELRERAVGVLSYIEAETIALELDWPDGRRWTDADSVSTAFITLGVLRASPSQIASAGNAKVIISPESLGGWAGDPNELAPVDHGVPDEYRP
jgi:hypothetical protein